MEGDTYGNEILEFMQETIAADNYRDLAARILKATASRLEADTATLWRAVKSESKRELILAATYNVEFLPVEREITYDILPSDTPNKKINGLTAWMAIKKKPVIADNPEDLKAPDKEWAGSHSGAWDRAQFWRGKSFGCLIGYPLTLEDNLLGVIKFERYSDNPSFSQRDKERVKRWSTMIALTLKGMISREEQERNRQEALRELSSRLLVPASLTYYEDIIKLTAKILNADICTLWLSDERKRKLNLAAQYGLNPKTISATKGYELPESESVPDGNINGLTAWTFVRKRPFYAHNWERLRDHPSHKGYWDKELWSSKPEEEFGCLYAAPLVAEGNPIGVIKVEKRQRPGFQPFTEVERATFDLISVLVSVAPPLKAVIRDKDALVLDYFHILRAPTSNAISALDSLREELNRKEKVRTQRVESRLKMLADNLSVAYTQTLNAFYVATLPDKPAVPNWRNISHDIIRPSISMFHRLFPEVDIVESRKTNEFELLLTDFQLKKVNVIIHNLVDNAIAFSNKKPVNIDVTIDPGESWLILSVIDSGIGISANMVDKIWEPGITSRSDELTRPESRGQGLATVSRIIAEFGWKKSLKSVPNEGATINIHINKKHWRKI
jgi:hypothetical protein